MERIIKFIKGNWAIILILVLTTVGFYVRYKGLGNLSLWVDEYNHALAAKSYNETGQFLRLSQIYDRAWIYTWFVAKSIKIFGYNEVGVRFPSVIFGTLMIPAFYFLGKILFNRKAGVLAAIVLTFMPQEIYWSKMCRMYTAFGLSFVLFVIFFFLLLKKIDFEKDGFFKIFKKKNFILFLILTIIFFILSYHFHFLTLWIIPVLIIYMTLKLMKVLLEKKKIGKLLLWFFSVIGLFAVFLVFLKLLVPSYFDRVLAMYIQFNNSGTLLTKNIIGQFKFPFLTLLFLTFGIIYFLNRRDKGSLFSFAFIVLLFINFYILKPHLFRHLYSLRLFYNLTVVVGALFFSELCFEKIVEKLKKDNFVKKHLKYFAFILAFILILFIAQIKVGWMYSANEKHDYYRTNTRAAFEHIKINGRENDAVIDLTGFHSLFYLGRFDYILRNIENSARFPDKNEIYFDLVARQVRSVERLEEIMDENERGWIYLDNGGKKEEFVNQDLQKYITENLQDHSPEIDGIVKLYSW